MSNSEKKHEISIWPKRAVVEQAKQLKKNGREIRKRREIKCHFPLVS